jgi:phosphatidylserine/phosphatidylglycerophosphate/cardiolipin synthase-like enzyme
VNNLQPVEPILSELKGAGLRGVRVVVLTNSKLAYQRRNGKLIGFFQNWFNNEFYQDKLRSPGIELWELDWPIHSKALTIDGVMASIGSYNFGRSSIAENTEQVVATYDPAVIAAVEAMFDVDLARATRVQ